jgi:hypothetical protein
MSPRTEPTKLFAWHFAGDGTGYIEVTKPEELRALAWWLENKKGC